MRELSQQECIRYEQEALRKKIESNKELLKTIVTDNFSKEVLSKDQLEAVLFFIRHKH